MGFNGGKNYPSRIITYRDGEMINDLTLKYDEKNDKRMHKI